MNKQIIMAIIVLLTVAPIASSDATQGACPSLQLERFRSAELPAFESRVKQLPVEQLDQLFETVGLESRIAELKDVLKSFDPDTYKSKVSYDLAIKARSIAATDFFLATGLTKQEASKLVSQLNGLRTLSEILIGWVGAVETNLLRTGVSPTVVKVVASIAAVWTFTPVSVLNALAATGNVGAWAFAPGTTQLEIATLYYAILYGTIGVKLFRPLLTPFRAAAQNTAQNTDPVGYNDALKKLEPKTISAIQTALNKFKDKHKKKVFSLFLSGAALFAVEKDIQLYISRQYNSFDSGSLVVPSE